MVSLFKTFIIILFFKFYGCTEVHYLRGVPRLGSTIYWDFYFSCSTEGQTLQWEVNGDPLGGFLIGDIARVFHSSRSNYNYTATLLSLQENGEWNSFDSLIIVSQIGYSNLTVLCGNGLVSNRTTNAINKTNLSSKSMGSIFLQNLLIEDIDTSIKNIFVCGVNNTFLIWETDNITYPFFSSPNSIGQDLNIRQNDRMVKLQAIFIAQTPYEIVSVLLVVADNTFTYAQCGNGENTLRFSIESASEETTTESHSEIPMSSFFTQITSGEFTSSASEIESNNNDMIVAIGVVSGISCAAIIVSVISILSCLLIIKKRHVPKSTNLQEQERHGHKQYMSIRQESAKWLDEEYEKLEKNEPASTSSCDIAKSNDDKNRFPNFYPYDEHRVILHSAKGSDYINATRIEGLGQQNQEIGQQKQKAKQPKTYFATQEPLPNTVDDFWRMIYEYNVTTIVVLTSIIERGKNEHYWQEQARMVALMKGTDLKITVKETTSYADYEIRNIEIECKSEKREVKHYQFLGWPPKEVPIFATSFIQFVRHVMHDFCFQRDSSAPLVVQSSSGIGRSGAFITVCAMMNKIEEEKDQPFSIYDFVCDLRSRSRFMVSSVTQYKFIYDVLEEMRKDGNTSLTIPLLRSQVNEYSSQMAEQFELLNEVSRIPDVKQQSEAQKYYNIKRNRSQDRVPYDDSRVQLRRTNHTGSDYINASFINGYKQPTRYIATQTPLKDTKSDFWRMIWEYGCQTIVSLWQQQNEQQEIQKFWPENGKYEDYGKLEVKIESEELFQNYRQIKISITKGETSQKLPVTLCQYDGWPESSKPSTTTDIRYLISSLKHSSSKYIAVMCSDGADRTGAFITIHAMIERFETEGIVDIFQFIKSSRINRAHLVTNLENFKFCHEVLAEYVEQRMTQQETSL